MRFPRFHFGTAIAMGLSMLCMSTVPVFADGLTPPSVSAAVSGSTVMLSWSIPAGAVSFVIRRSTSGFPATVSDGVSVATPDASTTTYNDSGLSDGVYYYSLFAFNGSSYSMGGHPSPVTVDTIAPSSPENFTGVVSGSGIHLSWTNPTDADFDSVFIFGSTASYIESTGSGGAVVIGLADTSWNVGSLADSAYYYTIFAKDTHGNYSLPAYLTFTIDTTPTAAPSDFIASVSRDDVMLSWANPTEPDFAFVVLRRDTSGYPVTVSDGTAITTTSDMTFADRTLANGIYYYSMFARDTNGNYSVAANLTVTVVATSSSIAAGQSSGGRHGVNGTARIIQALRGRSAGQVARNTGSDETPASPFQRRTCERVMHLFRGNEKMLGRVNVRLEKRFGFTCAE